MEPDRREFLAISAAGAAAAALPAELLARCDFTDDLTKAVLDFANPDPSAKPRGLTYWAKRLTVGQMSAAIEYTLQGKCRIPFHGWSDYPALPRHLCEACYEIGRKSPQLNPAHWLARHEHVRPHNPESMLQTCCIPCGGTGRVHGDDMCQECQGGGIVPTASGRAVLEQLGVRI
jgi:hypothetical protein